MTAAPPVPYKRLHAESHLSPLAKSLSEVFSLDHAQLNMLAADLSGGRIALAQTAVKFAAYVGPDVNHIQRIRGMAATGNALAQREMHDILDYHRQIRLDPLLAFLAQFPPRWRGLLLGTLREDVCGLEFKFGDGIVVELIHISDSCRYEYSLRGFTLTFKQTIEIARWMRANQDLLVLHDASQHLDSLVEIGAEPSKRMAALFALLDYFPEEYRSLLARKVKDEVTHVGFRTDPFGEVLMQVRYRT